MAGSQNPNDADPITPSRRPGRFVLEALAFTTGETWAYCGRINRTFGDFAHGFERNLGGESLTSHRYASTSTCAGREFDASSVALVFEALLNSVTGTVTARRLSSVYSVTRCSCF